VSLLDSTREWVAVTAGDVFPGDVLIRRGRPGPTIQSVSRLPDGWVVLNYAHGRGCSTPMRGWHPLVAERFHALDA